jgi:hypothetical protein
MLRKCGKCNRKGLELILCFIEWFHFCFPGNKLSSFLSLQLVNEE